MGICRFCTELEELKPYYNDTRNCDERIIHKREVASVVRSFRGSAKVNAGRNTYYGYTLNFCSECGRAIRKGLRK